ncbi:MAG TPA: vWA domain-containing protein [Methylibium sp.]|uniref:vWA domain-containing protein n=1 Tax=Methylibium sp. TaxID=2067992 RepID=UPI002DBBB0DC|nr:vWA domain-containing protein [Methylibium sp.]HEU4460091.1 vWA domain-containing protein [Methylibium sp.]
MNLDSLASALGLGFAQPLWLALLPLAALPLLGDGRAQRRHAWLALLPRDRASELLRWLLRVLGAAAIAALVGALAGLYRAEYEIERVGRGAEIVLLLDRSRSMDERFVYRVAGGPTPGTAAWYAYNQADDAERVSKGQAARRILAEFAAKREDDRFAMALFSTLPIGLFDFTRKPDIVQAAIAAGEVGRGLNETDIAAALLHGMAYFDRRPYTGSRIVLLVSDGGDHIDPAAKLQIAERLREQRVALYWIYIRSARSPGLQGADSPGGAADAVPEVSLDRFFRSTGAPYRVYEAESPDALKRAIDDVGRLENLPIAYAERVPRRDLTAGAYAVALAAVLLLLGSRWRGEAR